MCTDCGCSITDGNRHLLSKDHGHHSYRHHKHQHGHDHGHGHDHNHEHGSASHSSAALNSLMQHNDHHARENRNRFDQHGVLVINLMSSPGSGKTSLLEATIRALNGSLRIAVIEGDLETENDADRIRALGVPAHQITTGTACHLDAHLIEQSLTHLELANLDILFIENVGNLVCPASFDLGHHRNVILLSVTEGDDKPAKYPVMFRAADLMLLSKTDLLPHLPEFSPQMAEQSLRNLASQAPIMHVSARVSSSIDAWINWLRSTREEYRQRLDSGSTMTPAQDTDAHRTLRVVAPEVHFSTQPR